MHSMYVYILSRMCWSHWGRTVVPVLNIDISGLLSEINCTVYLSGKAIVVELL